MLQWLSHLVSDKRSKPPKIKIQFEKYRDVLITRIVVLFERLDNTIMTLWEMPFSNSEEIKTNLHNRRKIKKKKKQEGI